MDLRPGQRVLDLGCGRASSSIFLRREFGVQVWATDLWFSASENIQRIRDAGVEDGVFPVHADARSLPFAAEFFDAIISIDSFCYYGTDDLYLSYLARFVKPGAPIGTAGAGLMQDTLRWRWMLLPTIGMVLVLAFFLANVEIQIEGAAGWAAKLPTWRIPRNWWLDIFWGGRELTGYHAWIFPCMALFFHFPVIVFWRWSWRMDARV
jgi:SAM-dependent methyltransferase